MRPCRFSRRPSPALWCAALIGSLGLLHAFCAHAQPDTGRDNKHQMAAAMLTRALDLCLGKTKKCDEAEQLAVAGQRLCAESSTCNFARSYCSAALIYWAQGRLPAAYSALQLATPEDAQPERDPQSACAQARARLQGTRVDGWGQIHIHSDPPRHSGDAIAPPVEVELAEAERWTRWLLRAGDVLVLWLPLGVHTFRLLPEPARDLELIDTTPVDVFWDHRQTAARPKATPLPSPAPAAAPDRGPQSLAPPPPTGPQNISAPRRWPWVAGGIATAALGTALLSIGAVAVAVDGQCTDATCDRRYAGQPLGSIGLGVGIPLLVGGLTLTAIGLIPRRPSAATATPPSTAPLTRRAVPPSADPIPATARTAP